MKYQIRHETRYRYTEAVTNSQHDLHLLPRELPHQRCLSSGLDIKPMPSVCQERADYFGNRATHLEIQQPHRRMAVLSRSEIEIIPRQGPLPTIAPAWEVVRDRVRVIHSPADIDIRELAYPSAFAIPSAAVAAYAAPSFTPGRPIVEALVDLMHRIHADFTYDPQATNVSTPVEEVLAHRHGVCQDFAHLALACLRALGLPGRYVSGYLVTATPGQTALVGADASHAWIQSYCPGFGWIDLDPTNDVIPSDRHVTIAYGRDFGDVTPLRGVITGGGQHDLRVAVTVTPRSFNQ